jgi:ceramide glucosyltransferase
MEQQAKHELLIISDADVRVPADFLANFVEPLRTSQKRDEQSKKPSERACGLVNCFYRLANPTTLAMQWEAICINTDFWSQVLQSRSLKPLDFALGAVMGTRRRLVKEIGGFEKMADYLADDYELGNRIACLGYKIELCTAVVDCVASPMGWQKVWNHQLRWSRNHSSMPAGAYFFSVVSNPTVWPLLWLLVHPDLLSAAVCIVCCALRIIGALDLQQRMTQSRKHFVYWWLAPIKDLLQITIWLLAFAGNRIEWRGQRFRLSRDGTMEKIT